jgi:hypothetical protein
MKTFEYKSRYLFGDTVEKVDEFMRTLNTMGSDGWELVAIVPPLSNGLLAGDTATAFLKREKVVDK